MSPGLPTNRTFPELCNSENFISYLARNRTQKIAFKLRTSRSHCYMRYIVKKRKTNRLSPDSDKSTFAAFQQEATCRTPIESHGPTASHSHEVPTSAPGHTPATVAWAHALASVVVGRTWRAGRGLATRVSAGSIVRTARIATIARARQTTPSPSQS